MSSPGSVASSSTAGSSSPAVSHSTDSSLFSTNDSDYSTLSKLTRALLSLTGYNIPEDTPMPFTSDPSYSSSSALPSVLSHSPRGSPTPSPTKQSRSRSRRNSLSSHSSPNTSPSTPINWLPPACSPTLSTSSSSRPRPPKRSPSSLTSTTFDLFEESELVEWYEPRSCKIWRGRMKRVENRRMEVIHEEESGSDGELFAVEEKKGKPKKKPKRKRLSGHIEVFRDRVLSTARRGREREREGKRTSEGVLGEIEQNEKRKRRRRNSGRPHITPLQPPSSRSASPSSSPEEPVQRKSFFELEEEAIALEQHENRGGIVWVEENPSLSAFDGDEDDEEDKEEEEEEEEL